MNTEELFIELDKLPNPLSKKEVYELIDNGSELAKNKLLKHNIKLVVHQVKSRFKTVEYDQKELIQIGVIGLMKAIDNFDTAKNVEFATYATRCIDNEILVFLRKLKKHKNTVSLYETINYDENGNELKFCDIIHDDDNLEENYIDKETRNEIQEIVNNLPTLEREIIRLYYGFNNNRTYTQKEIAKKLNVSQSYVSRLIIRILNKIGFELISKGIVKLDETKTIVSYNEKTNVKIFEINRRFIKL